MEGSAPGGGVGGNGSDTGLDCGVWETGRTNEPGPNGAGPCREEIMQKKCEDCGVWADEEYILDMDGVELCVLCVHQLQVSSESHETEGVAE